MAHHGQGDLPAALEAFEEAADVRRASGDTPSVRIVEWMVAWTLRQLRRVDEARDIELRLQEERTAAGIDDVYVAEEIALSEGLARPDRR